METMAVVLSALALVAAALAAMGAWRRVRPEVDPDLLRRIEETERRVTDAVARTHGALEAAGRDSLQVAATAQRDFAAQLAARLDGMRDSQVASNATLQSTLETRLESVRAATETQLERIRVTVDEKLRATLETRLGESFKQVSERLEQVHQGLGEMKQLAGGVDDLRRVLSNVKARGGVGEVQLGAILDQVLAPNQFERNVETVPQSGKRVEFAIRLPGRDDREGVVYLPVDAKFPIEEYLRLQDALDAGDPGMVEAARQKLRRDLVAEAKSVREKYVAPPSTTDFALLFLSTEGLYAEALRITGLFEEVQRDHHVVLVGPTTLWAILNSLQMGFRTLAIERRSADVWRVLGTVKTEFAKFGEAIDAVSRKLQEAAHKVDDELSRRHRVLNRSLKGVEDVPVAPSEALLTGGPSEPE